MAKHPACILPVIALFSAAAQYSPPAQAGTETVVYSFGGTADDGAYPDSLLDVGGLLYGTTSQGGAYALGSVFVVATGGSENVVHSFRGGADGKYPDAGLTNANGTLFGTTIYGGGDGCSFEEGCGTVYKVHPDGHEAVIYAFMGHPDGQWPTASLITVANTLYGSTQLGGAGTQQYPNGIGTVFKMTKTGSETILHSFSLTDGYQPSTLLHANGLLYATTSSGGEHNLGTVFSMTLGGAETVLHSFGCRSYPCDDGAYPGSGVIYADGTFYGTTGFGGIQDEGTVFSMTPRGRVTILHAFGASKDGYDPYAGLIKVGKSLYGVTTKGGAYGLGTIFVVDADNGREAVLYSFGQPGDGTDPIASLIYVDGVFYGTTNLGGTYNSGTVFSYVP